MKARAETRSNLHEVAAFAAGKQRFLFLSQHQAF
jgi:hypothetical protein